MVAALLYAPLAALALTAGRQGTGRGQGPPAARKTPAEVAPYPPMQFHSFGEFKEHDEINEANMLGIAAALQTSGLAEAGYDTINVVCNGWVGRNASTGQLLENRTLWPNGIRGLAAKLHGMAPPLKLGCYTAPRDKNCMCNRLWVGGPCEEGTGPGYEGVDMAFFASSGCDHVMVDMPDGPGTAAAYRTRYQAISDGIAASSNPNMLYGVWSGPFAYSWKWAAGVGGHYWRIGGTSQLGRAVKQTWARWAMSLVSSTHLQLYAHRGPAWVCDVSHVQMRARRRIDRHPCC